MSSRKWLIAIGFIAAAIVVVLFVLKGKPKTQQSSERSVPGSATTESRRDRNFLGGSDVSPESRAKFDERKAAALPKLRRDLEERLQQCGADAVGSTPRELTLSLAWDPRLSTPELQRFIVTSASVVDASAPLSATGSRCLDTLSGATLNVLLPANELPRRDLTEGISLGLK